MMMNEARFGEAGRRIVIEEFLRGSECSIHALIDGKNYRLLESARDHKRAFDNDEGRTLAHGAFRSGEQLESQLQSKLEKGSDRAGAPRLAKEKSLIADCCIPGLMIRARVRACSSSIVALRPETQAFCRG